MPPPPYRPAGREQRPGAAPSCPKLYVHTADCGGKHWPAFLVPAGQQVFCVCVQLVQTPSTHSKQKLQDVPFALFCVTQVLFWQTFSLHGFGFTGQSAVLLHGMQPAVRLPA